MLRLSCMPGCQPGSCLQPHKDTTNSVPRKASFILLEKAAYSFVFSSVLLQLTRAYSIVPREHNHLSGSPKLCSSLLFAYQTLPVPEKETDSVTEGFIVKPTSMASAFISGIMNPNRTPEQTKAEKWHYLYDLLCMLPSGSIIKRIHHASQPYHQRTSSSFPETSPAQLQGLSEDLVEALKPENAFRMEKYILHRHLHLFPVYTTQSHLYYSDEAIFNGGTDL